MIASLTHITHNLSSQLVYDATYDRLMSWSSTSTAAAVLGESDTRLALSRLLCIQARPRTGAVPISGTGVVGKALFTSATYSPNGGASAVINNRVVASLLDVATLQPAFVGVDLATGKAQLTTQTDRNYPFTIALAAQ